MAIAVGVALQALRVAGTSAAPFMISRLIESFFSKTEASTKTKQLPVLREETERQELEMRIAAAQAKCAQEIAIASRIDSAEEVEIEEHYELKGEGQLGGKLTGEALTLGVSLGGQRVSKRVFRFRGHSQSPGTSFVVEEEK